MNLIKGKKYWREWKLFDRWGKCTGVGSGALEFTGEYDELTGDARMKDDSFDAEGFRMIPLKYVYGA